MKTLALLCVAFISFMLYAQWKDHWSLSPEAQAQLVAESTARDAAYKAAAVEAAKRASAAPETSLAYSCRNMAIAQQAKILHIHDLSLGKYTFEADENGTWMIWPWSGREAGNGEITQTSGVMFCHEAKDGGWNYRMGKDERDAPEWWKLSQQQVYANEDRKTDALRSGLPDWCRANALSQVKAVSGFAFVAFDDSTQRFTRADSDLAIWQIVVTGTTYSNVEIPYTVTCYHSAEGFGGNILDANGHSQHFGSD